MPLNGIDRFGFGVVCLGFLILCGQSGAQALKAPPKRLKHMRNGVAGSSGGQKAAGKKVWF